MTARLVTALVGTAVVAVGVLATAPAHADTVGSGPNGQRLTVSRTADLPRGGATVTVSGSGYDSTKGIYVAFCVDNGSGAAPSPCGGGADMGGTSGLSHWISSNPPAYGEGLAVPYGSGGTFRVQLRVSPKVGDVDCTVRRCVVSTRNDHTRGADRSQDVRIPVTFASAAAPTRTTAAPPSAPAPTGGAPASRPTGGGPATAQPTGGTTGGTASAQAAAPGDGGGAGGPGATAGGTDPAATQVTDSAGTGRWWTVVTAGLAVLLVALVAVRVRNRRRERA
ncbi:hypothetical protein CA850_06025 [Micromonospora echinospora]|uniref:MYXO-CTERM domain-containing protein n=1 Tax=Micromonospora echinospora TaxID=1877 RepID=A0A1C4V4B0_MICEC|nr:hypothetical protein [Micromonospora echinospora]OZV83062.1 hypothetical protein CA850_06025 [Micromonospora echinospora]SCE78579.1 hypothetical protein GA0070618_0916 [Micromonospora echinospora]